MTFLNNTAKLMMLGSLVYGTWQVSNRAHNDDLTNNIRNNGIIAEVKEADETVREIRNKLRRNIDIDIEDFNYFNIIIGETSTIEEYMTFWEETSRELRKTPEYARALSDLHDIELDNIHSIDKLLIALGVFSLSGIVYGSTMKK